MARRMLDSSIFADEFIGELSDTDKLLWIGLITACADDQGRLPLNPAIIRATVFPYSETITGADITASLIKFEQAGKIAIYQDGRNRELVQIVSWWKHQRPQWAQPSSHPAPDGWTDRVRYHASGNRIIMDSWDKPGGYPTIQPAHSNLYSALPTPLYSGVGYPIEKRREEKSREDEMRVEEIREDDVKRAKAPESPPENTALPSSSSDFSLCANQIPKNAAEAIKHPAIAVYQAVTGIVPARKDYAEVISAVVVCQVKTGLDPGSDLVAHLRAYFEAYAARKTRLGKLYDRRGLAWLTEWAASGQIPPERSNGRAPADYVLPDADEPEAKPIPTQPDEWQPEPDLKQRAGQLTAALEQLRAEMPPGNHKHLRGARLVSVSGDDWTVRVPRGSAAFCQDRLASAVQHFLRGIANNPNVKIVFQEPS